MRFVHHQQMLVLPQHHFVKWDVPLVRYSAVVIKPLSRCENALRGDSMARIVHHVARSQAVLPDGFSHTRKTVNQKLDEGRPRAVWRQYNATRTNPVAGGRRVGAEQGQSEKVLMRRV